MCTCRCSHLQVQMWQGSPLGNNISQHKNCCNKLCDINIYRYKCDRVKCDEECIGESSRNLWIEVQRTSKGPIPYISPYNTTGHKISIENLTQWGERQRTSQEPSKKSYISESWSILKIATLASTICHISWMRFCLHLKTKIKTVTKQNHLPLAITQPT